KQLNPANAVVGQGYIVQQRTKTKGDVVQFKYNKSSTKSQTSSLGISISGYGIDAGYSGQGTKQSTANAEVDYPNQTQSTWFHTEFNVARFRAECALAGTATPPFTTRSSMVIARKRTRPCTASRTMFAN